MTFLSLFIASEVINLDSFSMLFLDVFKSGIWATLEDLRDPSLKQLASRLETTLLSSKVPSTKDSYKCAFQRWKVDHIALNLQHVMDSRQSHTAVDSAIYGIQWAHNLARITSPTQSHCTRH